MKPDHPTHAQIPQLRALWKEAFGDSDAFLDIFFSTAYDPRRCRCITEDNRVLATLYWFDVTCTDEKMAYIYAVATAPAFREQGFCRALMGNAHSHLAALGYRGALLVPDGEALTRMYAGLGYRPCCGIREFVCSMGSEAAALRRIDAPEYARLRRKMIPRGGVIQENENLAFLETYAEFYAGLDFLLAAIRDEDKLLGLELLGNTDAAPGIVAALGCDEGSFRIPGSAPFAMYHPLSDSPAPAYFGLAFD
jgi:predicted N-acetyltransferase YhbS